MSYEKTNTKKQECHLKPPAGGIGHIDLWNKGNTGSGYYGATEVWFWPIK